MQELSNATKKSETKLRERAQALRNVDLYIILNPKTLQQASPEWIDKYVTIDATGAPTLKSNVKVKPRILTLTYRSNGSQDVSLALVLKPGEEPRAIRCWNLSSEASTTEISNLLGGYQHMLDPSDDEGSDDTAEYSLPGDEEGLRCCQSAFVFVGLVFP